MADAKTADELHTALANTQFFADSSFECKHKTQQLPRYDSRTVAWLSRRFTEQPSLVNESMARAVRLTRQALFPRLEAVYAERPVAFMVGYTYYLLTVWMKTSAQLLDTLRSAIYALVQGIAHHADWPWTTDESMESGSLPLCQILLCVARMTHGLAPLDTAQIQ